MDRGSFNEVPNAINKLASTKFTEALIKSNAAPCSSMTSSLSNRALSQVLALGGMLLTIKEDVFVVMRTNLRAMGEVPKLSSPASWRDRSREVLITLCAFLEVSRATTIIMPEPMRNMEGVEAESRREVIKY